MARCLTVGIVAAALAVGPWLGGVSSAASGGSAETPAAPEYLALGDSVTYGYDPRLAYPTPESKYIGYPTDVGAALSDTVVNAACSGDTSAAFVSADAPDHGCHALHAAVMLHVNYHGTQLDFATEFLRSHPSTRLVTIGIGLVDYFGCASQTSDHCVGELPSILDSYRKNLGTIMERIRTIYHGTLVLVNYFTMNYQEPIDTGGISKLNAVMAQVGQNYGAIVADTFSAFAAGSAAQGGDGCRAGLLIKTSTGCDVHPTADGRNLMAKTIEAALEKHAP